MNIVAGLGERKRPFSPLRLTGVSTALVYRVVALESALLAGRTGRFPVAPLARPFMVHIEPGAADAVRRRRSGWKGVAARVTC